MPTFCCLLKTVSKRVENPLFLPLRATNQKGHGCFPMRRILEVYRRIKELGKQLKNLGMLVIQDQVWNRVTVNRSEGKATRYYVDEFHLLLRGEVGSWSVEIWKRFRKWGGIPTGITQNIKDLLASAEIENIFENSDFIYLLNQASGDRKILCERLNISNQQAAHISNSGPDRGLSFSAT